MLQIKNLSKIYSNGASKVIALDNLSINFGYKGLVVILGKSGCGKSTLINMIGGLDYPTSGEVIINGKSSKTFSKSELDSYRNTFVGVVFQEFNLIDEISVFENIDMTMKLQEKNADVNTVDEVLSMVGLSNLGYRKPSELSGGQRQRVALARALLKKPEIILADEPTGSLDSGTGEEVFESLKKIAQDKLVIVVTHDKDLAYTYGERIVEIQDGKIVLDRVRQSESSKDIRELSNNVIEVASPSRLSADLINKRLKKDEVNYIGLSHDKERIALAYCETVDCFYEKADAHLYTPTQSEDIKTDDKPFVLSKGKLQLKEAFKMAKANIKRTKKRYRLLSLLTTFCFTFLIVAIILGTVNIPGLIAKSAFSKNSQPVLTITKTQKDEWGNLYEVSLDSDDIGRVTDVLGVDSYSRHVSAEFSPIFASFEGNDYDSNNYQYKFNGFTGVFTGQPKDLNLELVSNSKAYCDGNELIISDMAAFEITRSGYVGMDEGGESGIFYPSQIEDVLGISLKMQSGAAYNKSDMKGYYKIVGIYKTDYQDYKRVMTASPLDTKANKLLVSYLQNLEFFYSKAFVSETFLENYASDFSLNNIAIGYNYPDYYNLSSGGDLSFMAYDKDNADYYTNNGLFWSKNGNLELPEKLNKGEIILTYAAACNLAGVSQSLLDDLKTNTAFTSLVNKPLKVEMNARLGKSYRDASQTKEYTIVGVFPSENEGSFNIYGAQAYFSRDDLVEFASSGDSSSIYLPRVGSRFSLEGKVRTLIKEGYYAGSGSLNALAIFELQSVLDILVKVFYGISLGFGVFAFLIIFNYMSASVRFRRKEIAVFRVMGAKSRDIARIFLSEGFVISLRTTVWVSIIAWFICWLINTILSSIVSMLGISVTLISFTIFHPIIVFVLIAVFFALSSLLPISMVTRKTPVEALKML